MATQRKAEPKVTVTWLQEVQTPPKTRMGRHIEELKSEDDIFVRTENVPFKVDDDRLERLYAEWKAGNVADDDFMFKMQELYTQNSAIGSSVLTDNRVRVDNRVELHVLFATSVLGQDEDEARKYALEFIAQQGLEQGGIGGPNRGKVKTLRDIRKK